MPKAIEMKTSLDCEREAYIEWSPTAIMGS